MWDKLELNWFEKCPKCFGRLNLLQFLLVYVFIIDDNDSTMVEEILVSYVLVVSTAVLAIVGIINLYHNRKIISEMKTERKYNLAPFVT